MATLVRISASLAAFTILVGCMGAATGPEPTPSEMAELKAAQEAAIAAECALYKNLDITPEGC